MTKNEKINVLFWLKRQKQNKQGYCPIICRITINGQACDFSTRIKTKPAHWDVKRKKIKGNSEIISMYNAMLTDIEHKALQFYYVLQGRGGASPDRIKDLIQGVEKINYTFLEVFTKHNATYQTKKASHQAYEVRKNHFEIFLSSHLQKQDIDISQVNSSLAYQFEAYLQEKGFKKNYIVKCVQALKKVLVFAHQNGWIENNNLQYFQIKKEKPGPIIYLSTFEINQISTYPYSNARLKRVADLFLFCCFTGLAFVDLVKLSKNDIYINPHDNREWIKKKRQKSGTESNLPLLQAAKAIWQKYDYKLPVLTNQKYNAYLKEIADLCRIDKKLTTHVARKTFANLCLNEWNIPIETVSKMLGHANIGITESTYAQITDKKLSNDLKNIL